MAGTAAIERPRGADDAARALRDAAAGGTRVRFTGGGTKLAWGGPVEAGLELSTAGLDSLLEHNEGDLTAVVQAGVALADAQRAFAGAGQRLALDPPDAGGATIGGVLACGDSGPLRHRYGAARDQVLGMTVALGDGTLARSGGKVIKNVAGYDLGKLFCGSLGSLGLIVEVALRLHPLPRSTATVRLAMDDPDALGRAALDLAARPLELESLDVRWLHGEGALLARFAGAAAAERARAEGGEMMEDDDALWAAQRAGQLGAGGTVVRVSALASELPRVLRAGDALGVPLVGRAGLGLSWLELPDGDDSLAALRAALAPRTCVALGPARDPWGPVAPDALRLARRVKERFDPAGACNPGIMPGGL